jgi:hypothetical protein
LGGGEDKYTSNIEWKGREREGKEEKGKDGKWKEGKEKGGKKKKQGRKEIEKDRHWAQCTPTYSLIMTRAFSQR